MRFKKNHLFLFSTIIILTMVSLIGITPNGNKTIYNNNSKINTCDDNLTDPWALETSGNVYSSFNGSNPWTFTGSLPPGYNFVSTAADNNNTYVLTNDGQIWRHNNNSWKVSTWSKLQVPLPYISNEWVSIDVSNEYIYVLHSSGDAYRILKDPGWPTPGVWVQSSNPIPIALPAPLLHTVSSFVSIAVDWNDSFCFVLRNNGEVYRHDCDGAALWGFPGSWTAPASIWNIYAGYGAPRPFTLEHADGSGSYWGIPSTSWVSIDVFDNYFEPNYSVYVLHASGLVAKHTNIQGWLFDSWLNPNEIWKLDPRWPIDWPAPATWGSSTAFVSISCNDVDIFILKNTGEVFWIPEAQFEFLLAPWISWAWVSAGVASPLPLPKESKTSAYISIDAWNGPFILKNDGKEWSNPKYNTATPAWEDCWDNYRNNGKGTLYPQVFSYSSIAAYSPSIQFVLSLNGTIYKSVNSGVNWTKFGNLGYGNDSAWISIAAANYRNHSYIYALYNNGTVVRTPANIFSRSNWGNCNTGPYDTSWVSIALDENATAYTLRNLGWVSYKFQGGSWVSKGGTVGNKIHPDSSWVSISAYKTNGWVIALRNDEIYDWAWGGAYTPFANFNPIPGPDSSFTAVCHLPSNILILQSNGTVEDLTLKNIGTIPGVDGFVDICYFMDRFPWNSPTVSPIRVSNVGTHYVTWTLFDDTNLKEYYVYENATLKSYVQSPPNGTTVNYLINTSQSAVFNYLIVYSDGMGQVSNNLITVIVDYYPWSNHPSDIATHQSTGTEKVNWTLYDDRGYSHYRVVINGTPGNWNTWSTNVTAIQYPINRTIIGKFNYTIQFNDSNNQFNSDTVWVTVYSTNNPPQSNQPTTPVYVYVNTTSYIDWILTDDIGAGKFRVLINNTPGSWASWTDGVSVHYQITTTSVGTFNYTIEYNDSLGVFGTPNTVIVIIRPLTTTSTTPIPGFSVFFIILGILSLILYFKKSKKIL
ncbi:MAG: hypothetical protein ACTSPY_12635 [Candidatus Helarchaeota archaeon]